MKRGRRVAAGEGSVVGGVLNPAISFSINERDVIISSDSKIIYIKNKAAL
jgi:hypothetical protein